MLLFSKCSLDDWISVGGAAPLIDDDSYEFSLTDAVFIRGFRSKPKALKNSTNVGVTISNPSQSTSIHLTDDGISIVGNLTVDGNITGSAVATSAGVDLGTHVHTVTHGSSSGDTTPPK